MEMGHDLDTSHISGLGYYTRSMYVSTGWQRFLELKKRLLHWDRKSKNVMCNVMFH